MAIRPKGRKWQVDLTVNGQRLPRYSFDTREQALAWEAKARAAILSGEPLPDPNAPIHGKAGGNGKVTLKDACDRTFERYYTKTAWGVRARLLMNQIIASVGEETPLADVGTMEIDKIVSDSEKAGHSDATINKKLAVLSKVFGYALDRGLVDRRPRIERRKEKNVRFRWLSEDEERTLLNLLRQWEKHDHADAVTLLIDTGMRPSELYNVTPRDVDRKERRISIWENKTDHPRTVYLTNRAFEIVDKRVGVATIPNEKLFPYDNGWMRNVWDKARSVLGYDNDENFVPYICRHTCASRLVQRGVALGVVKEWLGHKSITTTMRYAFLAPTNLKAAVGALET